MIYRLEALQARRLLSAGELDVTFGTGGLRTELFEDAIATVDATAVQDDGKFLVAGYLNPFTGTSDRLSISRYLPDGSDDPTFSAPAAELSPLGAFVTVRPLRSGRIIAVGYKGFVARLNADGSLDTSYGGEASGNPAGTPPGLAAVDLEGVPPFFRDADVDPISGRVILIGGADDQADLQSGLYLNTMGVFNAGGAPDRSFGGGDGLLQHAGRHGTSRDSWQQVAIAPDGKTVVGTEGERYESAGDTQPVDDFIRAALPRRRHARRHLQRQRDVRPTVGVQRLGHQRRGGVVRWVGDRRGGGQRGDDDLQVHARRRGRHCVRRRRLDRDAVRAEPLLGVE